MASHLVYYRYSLRVRQERITNSNLQIAKAEKEIAKQKILDEKESWHNLVVKIISWKDDTVRKDSSSPVEKISPEEWKRYKKRLTEVNTVYNDTRKIEARLKDTFEKIEENGGFA